MASYPGVGRMAVSGQRVKIGQLLMGFENYLGRQLVDEMGLTGDYDFRILYAFRGLGPAPTDVPADPLPTAREALEAQGFRFESAKRSVDVMVIDAVNPDPTEN